MDDESEYEQEVISTAQVLAIRQLARANAQRLRPSTLSDSTFVQQFVSAVEAPSSVRSKSRKVQGTTIRLRSLTPVLPASSQVHDKEGRPNTTLSKSADARMTFTPRTTARRRMPLPGEKGDGPPTIMGYSNMFSEVNAVAKEAHVCARASEMYMQQAEQRLEELQQLVQLAAQHATPKRREVYCRIPNQLDELLARKVMVDTQSFKLPRIFHTTVSAMQAIKRPSAADDLLDDNVSPLSLQRRSKAVKLTPASSVMLQMGLKFGLPKINARQLLAESRNGAEASLEKPQYATTPRTLSNYLKSVGWKGHSLDDDGLTPSDSSSIASSSSSDLSDENEEIVIPGFEDPAHRHQAAKARRKEARELRLHNLRKQIEERDTLRATALQISRGKPRMVADGLRAAMWLTIVVLGSHSFVDAPRRKRLQQVISHCLLPMFRRFMFHKKRKAARMFLNAWGRTRVRSMTISELRATGPLFSKWPDRNLDTFLHKLRLTVFRPGEVICHKGDVSDYLYIIVRGSVEVIVLQSSSVSKGRGRKSGVLVAIMKPPKYVGEYGVFADEPRSATLVAKDYVFCWTCSKEVFRFELSRLPAQVRMEIKKTLEANMNQIYKVRPAQLASTVLFLNWDLRVLEELVTKLEPFVFSENQVMVKQGDSGTCLFIIARGKCESVVVCKSPVDGEPIVHATHLSSGDQLGQRGCLFVEPQPATVRAVTTVQAWKLRKSILMDYMLQRPDWFLGAKQRLNREYEKFIPKPPIKHMLGCGLFPADFHQRLAERIYEMCLQPRVVESTAPLVLAGEEVRGIFLIVGGSCVFEGKPCGAGRTIGVDQVLRQDSIWNESIVANARLDVWFLCFKTLYNVLQKPGKVPANNPQLLRMQQLLQQWKDNAR